jgi:hypothetical protein
MYPWNLEFISELNENLKEYDGCVLYLPTYTEWNFILTDALSIKYMDSEDCSGTTNISVN